MAFENVNVDGLRQAINQCIDSINHKYTEECIDKISNNNVCQSSSRDNLKAALVKLTGERYNDLEIMLNKFLDITDIIEKYKSIQLLINNNEQEILSLESDLYYMEEYNVTKTYKEGKKYTETEKRRVKDYDVEYRINSLDREIEMSKDELLKLENSIANSI